jgi:hypothetical protein
MSNLGIKFKLLEKKEKNDKIQMKFILKLYEEDEFFMKFEKKISYII